MFINILEHEYELDDIHQSTQDFVKENQRRMKKKEIDEMKVHAAIQRQEFERQEKLKKEKEIQDKEIQMSKLEEERVLLKKEFNKHEEQLKELNL